MNTPWGYIKTPFKVPDYVKSRKYEPVYGPYIDTEHINALRDIPKEKEIEQELLYKIRLEEKLVAFLYEERDIVLPFLQVDPYLSAVQNLTRLQKALERCKYRIKILEDTIRIFDVNYKYKDKFRIYKLLF